MSQDMTTFVVRVTFLGLTTLLVCLIALAIYGARDVVTRAAKRFCQRYPYRSLRAWVLAMYVALPCIASSPITIFVAFGLMFSDRPWAGLALFFWLVLCGLVLTQANRIIDEFERQQEEQRQKPPKKKKRAKRTRTRPPRRIVM